MNKIVIPLCVIVFIMGATVSWCATSQDTGKQGNEAVGQKVQFDHPEKNFIAAQTYFLKKEYKKSAEEIRNGSEILKKKADQAGAETKEELMKSAKDLDALADNVEKGAVKSEKTLKDSFTRAHYALARYYKESASESFAKKEYKKAGQELKLSAMYLETGIKWTGNKIQKGTATVIADSRRMGDKLVKGSGRAADEFGKGMTYLGDEITKFGNNIEGTKKE